MSVTIPPPSGGDAAAGGVGLAVDAHGFRVSTPTGAEFSSMMQWPTSWPNSSFSSSSAAVAGVGVGGEFGGGGHAFQFSGNAVQQQQHLHYHQPQQKQQQHDNDWDVGSGEGQDELIDSEAGVAGVGFYLGSDLGGLGDLSQSHPLSAASPFGGPSSSSSSSISYSSSSSSTAFKR